MTWILLVLGGCLIHACGVKFYQCFMGPQVWLRGALALVGAGVVCGSTVRAAEPVVSAGAGSYRVSPPSHCKPLPERIFKTGNVDRVPTNQWWSSLIWQPHSQNLFFHPGFVRCNPDGLVVGYQGRHVHGNSHGIFGSADLVRGDFKIGHSKQDAFPSAECDGYSDWFVTALFEEGEASLATSFGHGSPYVYGMIEGGDPVVTFVSKPQVWGTSINEATIGITIHGNHYGLFGESGSRWERTSDNVFVGVDRSNRHFSVAMLPDNRVETLEYFARFAHAHVTDTRVAFKRDGGRVTSTFQFTCTSREGSGTDTLFALYPHQWKYIEKETTLTDFTYGSVRGTMKVASGNQFVTSVPVQGVLPMLPAEGIVDSGELVKQLKAEAGKKHPGIADTYWEGKYLGSLASLSGTAQAAGQTNLQNQFVSELKRRLENWFTATPTKKQPVFYYDNHWGSLIGSRPSYGSDRLNDHHFHYGYFIRAAAEIMRVDPEWGKTWGPMVELLIRDIATPDREDSLFPHLRCFDKYAGHSWASGDANFGDGNNQESSSESLNAWYSIMLWGALTDNSELLDLGTCLFNIERTAVEEYWFDVSKTNFPTEYPHVALGMVWGGKGAFATWFSGEIDHIHGINWLPFTPASLYMGRHPDYVNKNFQRILEKRRGGNDFNSDWGDLVLMFGALHDPSHARQHLASNPNCKIENGNSRPFMRHWVECLDALGQIDPTTSSNHPFTNVFIKDGRKCYAAYNFQSNPITITFSDGTEMALPPKVLKTQQ